MTAMRLKKKALDDVPHVQDPSFPPEPPKAEHEKTPPQKRKKASSQGKKIVRGRQRRSVRDLAPSEKGLGSKHGYLTPGSVLWGVVRFITVHILDLFHLFALLLGRPLSLHKKIDVMNLAVSIDSLKFFVFAMFITFACGLRVNVEFLNMFQMKTPFDNFIFEISCFIFLMVWSIIQNFILSIWCHHKKLFQITLAINACIFGFVLVSMAFANVIFTFIEMFFKDLFFMIGVSSPEVWSYLAWIYLALYVPFLIYAVYFRWLCHIAKVPRLGVAVSLLLSIVISAELLYFSLTYIKIGLNFVREYGRVVGSG